MKKIIRITSILLVIVALICCSCVSAFAKTTTQDNLEVQLVTDKTNYTKGEQILVNLIVTNVGSDEIKNVNLQNVIPDNYKLADESILEKSISSLKADETISLSTVLVALETSTQTVSTQPTEEKQEYPSNNHTVSASGVVQTNNTSNVSTASESTNDNIVSSGATVNTGDRSGVLIVLVFVVIVTATIVFILKYRKQSVRVLSIFLCMAVFASAFPITYFAISENDSNNDFINKNVQIQEKITVDGEKITLVSNVKYSIKNQYNVHYVDDDLTYTKGEWVTFINDTFGIENIQVYEGYDYFYGDSIDSEYGIAVETAYVNGILPPPDSEGYEDPTQDIPMFEAEKTATREFAAYTVAKAMGFEGNYTFNADDIADVKYVSEVAVIVNQSFMLLQNNRFNPASAVTGADVNTIINMMNYFNDDLNIDESDFKDDITLQDDIISISNKNYQILENDDETYTVTIEKNDEIAKIEEGTVFLLPANDEYLGGISLKAVEITSYQNNYSILCIKPDIEEVVDTFEFAGYGTADIENIQLTEDVKAEYDPNGVIEDNFDEEPSAFDLGGSTPIPGTLKINLDNKKVGKNKDVTLSGDIEVSIPKITAKAKGKVFGGFSIDELTFSVTEKTKVYGSLKYDFGIPESSYEVTTGNPTFGLGKTEITTIPIALGATGFTIDIVIFVNLEVSGRISISYTVENTSGIQYKDGAFRTIKDHSTSFNGIEANATAKFGPGVAARLTLFSVFDIVGLDTHIGLGITAKFTAHLDSEPYLYCADGTIYLYWTIELDDETLIVDILKRTYNTTWTWRIFTEESSPFKKKVHLENMKLVNSCTYGKGSLLGIVKDVSTGKAITNAKVRLYNNTTNQLVMSGYTKNGLCLDEYGNTLYKGEFLVQDLTAGSYRMEVSATGYNIATVNVDVIKNQRVVCEATLMLKRSDNQGAGTVKGDITDALTGSLVNGVSYSIRKGLNNISGNVIDSGLVDGSYSINLDPGYYSIEFSKSGYIKEIKSVTISKDTTSVENVAMTPSSDISINDSGFRVVLTWGAEPRDLDSHMFYKNGASTVFHTWYGGKNYYQSGNLVANLDLDDVTSYGPETSTVYSMGSDGIYSFYVHDYTNRSSLNCNLMSMSGAQVKLYSGNSLLATFNIPENRYGTVWHVFDYDSATDEFSYVNELSYNM